MNPLIRIAVCAALVLCIAVSARAEEGEGMTSCAAAWRAYIYGPLTVVKAMADYKAALDAGYEACSGADPESFDGTQEQRAFLAENTVREMDDASAVLVYLMDHADNGAVPDSCAADNTVIGQVKKEVSIIVNGQYDKAYGRRLKSLSEGEKADSGHDSCKLILKTLRQYGDNYDRYHELRNVLYETSKKKKGVVLSGRERKAALRRFETARATVVSQE